jgi:hypothetical protein
MFQGPIPRRISDFGVESGGEGDTDAGHGSQQGPRGDCQAAGNGLVHVLKTGAEVLVHGDLVGQIDL